MDRRLCSFITNLGSKLQAPGQGLVKLMVVYPGLTEMLWLRCLHSLSPQWTWASTAQLHQQSVGLCRAEAKAGAPVSDLTRLGTVQANSSQESHTGSKEASTAVGTLYKSLLNITWTAASISSSPPHNSHMKLASFYWAFFLGDPALGIIFFCLWTFCIIHRHLAAWLVSKPTAKASAVNFSWSQGMSPSSALPVPI